LYFGKPSNTCHQTIHSIRSRTRYFEFENKSSCMIWPSDNNTCHDLSNKDSLTCVNESHLQLISYIKLGWGLRRGRHVLSFSAYRKESHTKHTYTHIHFHHMRFEFLDQDVSLTSRPPFIIPSLPFCGFSKLPSMLCYMGSNMGIISKMLYVRRNIEIFNNLEYECYSILIEIYFIHNIFY
jgi:hypothetical protein